MPQRFSDYSSRRFVPTGQKGATYKASMEEARPRGTLPVVVSGKAGKPLEDLSVEPMSIGIHDVRKVTHPIFYHDHYDRIFAPIDKEKIASRPELIPEQVVLLAYRALSSVTYSDPITEAILAVSEQHGYKHSLSEPARYARLQRFQARDILLKAYQRYEQIHLTQDYKQLGWFVSPVNVPPCVATTYSLIPINDDEATSIVGNTLALTAEDVISFTFLPHPRLDNSTCVISWLKGSQRAQWQ